MLMDGHRRMEALNNVVQYDIFAGICVSEILELVTVTHFVFYHFKCITTIVGIIKYTYFSV